MSAQFIREPITSSPDPMEAVAIYRAQSLLTKNGKVGPILPPDKALSVIRAFERKSRVTVPQPRADTPVPLPAGDSRPGCAAQASTCKDLVPVVRVLRDDETGEVYEVAERRVEYPAPPF